ncbi:amidohydrolase family protein [Defluviimonas sp. WL0024]|uniref:Amidohydrolase family protein n=1 Tax=Albidovulum salinarum TaxID=2984153 RepID=A0ABT2X4T9_9RHOB|nr:amidohydrolase family protein [Defluviimonas sp. WL0024]MCU9848954.1 amidohydrolase family protein [Defluviimonas sp. WL0024]
MAKRFSSLFMVFLSLEVEAMRRGIVTSVLLVLADIAAQEAAADAFAFVNANVLPMDENKVLLQQTVVVDGDSIVAVAPTSEVEVPHGATVIDAEGSWLIPGFADMHMHLAVDPSPDFMRLWLAEGVTTVRNLNTVPDHRNWAEEVLAGERIGPTIYNTGPSIVGPPPDVVPLLYGFRIALISGPLILFLLAAAALRLARGCWPARPAMLGCSAVMLAAGLGMMMTRAIPFDAFTSIYFPFADVAETETEARRWVSRQVDDGYRMVKIYEFMGGPVWLAAQEAAEASGVYSISHLDPGAQLEDIVTSGVDEFAHVDELLDYFLVEEIDPWNFRPVPVDMASLPDVVATIAGQDLMVVSNMVADENVWHYLEAGPSYFDRPEYSVIRPETLAGWRTGRVVRWQGQQDIRRDSWQPLFAALVRELHATGVPILTGTDVSIDGIVPWHIHREIELLSEAGLSRYEALRAATANAGESLRRAGFGDVIGTVTPGARADLVLLRHNPLIENGSTRDRIGVMARGLWYSQAELDELTAELVASY